MANETVSKSQTGLPIPYITAVWTGMSRDDIVAGLRSGTILAPPGSPSEWIPESIAGQINNGGGLHGDPVAAQEPIDQSKVKAWFTALDPSLTAETFDTIWQGAGANEAVRAQTLTHFLECAVLGKSYAAGGSNSYTDATATTSTASSIHALDAFVADPAHHTKIVALSHMTGSEIAAKAQTDIGYRYALSTMQPIALTENRALFAAQNADGHLDRFDPDSGESLLSGDWMSDRSKFLAWKVGADAGDDMVIAGSENWTFIDRTTTDATGNPTRLELKAGDTGAGNNQVVFGNDTDEVIRGVAGSDRIYGGGGDDVLRGGAGSDHLEGGAGDDLALGGVGNDEILGNQGNDELDGGAGDDRIAGGSGADILTGGRGTDRLEGGTGNDTYVIDAGDGHDTVVDADGIGTIELDGGNLRGTMQQTGDQWLSADGRVEFAFSGYSAEGGTLTIKAFDASADHAGIPANVVDVKNWKNGDLGITLGGLGTTSAAPADAVAASELSTGSDGSADAAASQASDNATESGDAGAAASASNGSSSDAAASETGAASDGAASDGAGNGASAELFDFDSAVDSLLGQQTFSSGAVDPVSLRSAIEAFSAVLAPPDVDMAFDATGDMGSAVTEAHLADALATDTGSDDFAHETAMAPLMSVPELRQAGLMPGTVERMVSPTEDVSRRPN